MLLRPDTNAGNQPFKRDGTSKLLERPRNRDGGMRFNVLLAPRFDLRDVTACQIRSLIESARRNSQVLTCDSNSIANGSRSHEY